MQTQFLRKLTYSNVVSTLCLFLLLGSGAYAAFKLPKNSVGTKQLKNGAVTKAKIAAAAQAALRGAQGPIGPPGPPGSAAAAYGPIPSGATVTGSWNYFSPPSAGVDLVEAFPAPAPVALTNADVNFGNEPEELAADKDPTCSGNSSAPTAPPGKVCIYLDHGSTSPKALVGKALQVLPSSPTSRYGFEIATEAGANGQAGGTWAYTAP